MFLCAKLRKLAEWWWLSYITCRSSRPNGQPKWLLSLIPDYPLLNFMLTTSVYLFVSDWILLLSWKIIETNKIWIDSFCPISLHLQISYRIFDLTNSLKAAFLPSKDNKRLAHNLIAGIVISLCLYVMSLALLQIPPL